MTPEKNDRDVKANINNSIVVIDTPRKASHKVTQTPETSIPLKESSERIEKFLVKYIFIYHISMIVTTYLESLKAAFQTKSLFIQGAICRDAF